MATERKVTKSSSLQHLGAPPPSEPEHIPCPRCDSTNTKFCYYNNYNFSQPRHFCKSCRRYWTHGGTLRDIPVGGGSRKNAKRSRSVSSTTTTSSSSAITHHNSPVFMPDYRHHQVLMPFAEHGGSFTSLLTNQAAGLGGGLFGLGFGSGLVDELGRGVWGFQGGPGVGGWQVETAGDCFSLPELAISTPAGNLFK